MRPNGRACQQLVGDVVRTDGQRDLLLYIRNDILVFTIGILRASQQFRYTVYCTVCAYSQRFRARECGFELEVATCRRRPDACARIGRHARYRWERYRVGQSWRNLVAYADIDNTVRSDIQVQRIFLTIYLHLTRVNLEVV